MRLGLALLLLVLLATPAHAAIAHVQTVSCSSSGAASCTTGSITTTTGNLFVVSTSWGYQSTTTFTSITDSKGNSYVNAIANTPSDGGSGDAVARQDYKANGTGGSGHTFTGTLADAYFITISATEISGAETASPLDKTATGSSGLAMSHATASTATTAQANELLVGFGVSIDTASYTVGGTFTERTNIPAVDLTTNGLVAGTRVVAATGAYAFDFATDVAVRTASGLSTWKEATAAGVRQQCVGCGSDRKVIE